MKAEPGVPNLVGRSGISDPECRLGADSTTIELARSFRGAAA